MQVLCAGVGMYLSVCIVRVSASMCMHGHVCIAVCQCPCECVYLYNYICTQVLCICMHLCACMFICVNTHASLCMSVCSLCVHVYMCVSVCLHACAMEWEQTEALNVFPETRWVSVSCLAVPTLCILHSKWPPLSVLEHDRSLKGASQGGGQAAPKPAGVW